MKKLGELLEEARQGAHRDLSISGVSLDSRAVKQGELFFAVSGAKFDARTVIPAAFAAGAAAAVVEGERPAATGPIISVPDIRLSCGLAAASFYDHPTENLLSIGVTGTNGKTSVTWILAEALSLLALPAAHVGTLGMRVVSQLPESEIGWRGIPNTSPDPISFQRFLAEGLATGAKAAVSEVTSQGLLQGRTAGTQWDAAVFTNLTRDHLDLHGSMEAYAAAKQRLFFDELARSPKPKRLAVVNSADPLGAELAVRLRRQHPEIKVITFAARGCDADAVVRRSSCTLHETEFTCSICGVELTIRSGLIGAFNVENLLAAAATLVGLGFKAAEVARAIGAVPPVPGRLELAKAAAVSVVVDYSHTPDSLIKAQGALREIGKGRLITVFGCGGDRDRGKRPLMGAAVAEHSEVAIITSDNPRSEDPIAIIDDVLPGVFVESEGGDRCRDWRCRRVYTLPDRREAIREAIQLAQPGDTVLVAGKGHEDYQEVRGVKIPFSDIETCRALIDELLPK